MKYLLNRQWEEAGFDWYEPARILKHYKPIVKAEYMNTMSSAGDWDGLAVAQQGKRYVVFVFSQENRYPYRGYRMSTGDVVVSLPAIPSDDELGEIYNQIIY